MTSKELVFTVWALLSITLTMMMASYLNNATEEYHKLQDTMLSSGVAFVNKDGEIRPITEFGDFSGAASCPIGE